MDLQGAPNFRDLGGLPAADGRKIASRRLFRSEVLDRLTPDDMARLGEIRVCAVCDLRSAEERAEEVGLWPAQESARLILTAAPGAPDVVKRTGWADRLRDERFDGPQARERMVRAYRRMPETFASALAELFEHLETMQHGVLIHCMAGKDRTGFVVAMVLSALGAPRAAIYDDYLETGRRAATAPKVLEVLQKMFGPDPPARARAAAVEVGAVRLEYLDAAFAQVAADFGSVDAYLARLAAPRRLARVREALLV